MLRKLVLGIAALLALVCGGLLAVGASRPVEHVASVGLELEAPPERVWALVTDLAGWPEWNSMYTRAERIDDVDGRPRWHLEGEWGPMPSIVDELGERHMVTRIDPTAELGFGGTWTYALTPSAGAGCRLVLREDGFIDSALMRGLSALMWSNTAAMERFLGDLADHLGEEAEPEVLIAGD